MIEERDLDAPWEPWTPQVGQRVRVRLSPECFCYPLRTDPGWHYDNATGTVTNGESRYHSPIHRYGVWPDRSWGEINQRSTAYFAAIELEPIEEEQS